LKRGREVLTLNPNWGGGSFLAAWYQEKEKKKEPKPGRRKKSPFGFE